MKEAELLNTITLLDDLMSVKGYSRYDLPSFDTAAPHEVSMGNRADEPPVRVIYKGFKAFDNNDMSVFSFSYHPYIDQHDIYYTEFHYKDIVVERADFDIIQYLIRRDDE